MERNLHSLQKPVNYLVREELGRNEFSLGPAPETLSPRLNRSIVSGRVSGQTRRCSGSASRGILLPRHDPFLW